MDFSVSALLAVFSEPAFYAESGFISAVNPAAEAIGLEVGCPLNLILIRSPPAARMRPWTARLRCAGLPSFFAAAVSAAVF